MLQLAILSVFLYNLSDAQNKLDDARRSALIVQKVMALHHGLGEWLTRFALSLGTGKVSGGKSPLVRAEELQKEFESLEKEFRKNSADYKNLTDAKDSFEYLASRVIPVGKSMSDGTIDLPQLLRFRQESESSLVGHIGDSSRPLLQIASRHSQKAGALNNLSQKRQNMFSLLIVGMFGLNMGVLSITVLVFSFGVTRRLAVLNDNFIRFSKNEALNSPQLGGDEICTLDTAFRVLATKLEERAAKDKAVFTHMPNGLIACDEHGLIESINPPAATMFGANELELVGKPIAVLLNQRDDNSKVPALLPEEGKYEIKNTKVPVDSSFSTYVLEGNKKYLFAFVDITAREEVERMKQEFLSMVSHDLQSPLTSIGACLELLSAQIPKDISEPHKFLKMASKQSERLIRMTRDILDLARAESGQLVLNREMTPSEVMIEQSVGSVLHYAQSKRVDIDYATAPLHSMTLYVDPDKICQILTNFLSNAIKYSPSDTKITVTNKRIDNCVRFYVADQGRGIPSSSIGQVFDRFRQVESGDARVGTGLGLAICKLLAEAHGGRVGVESKEGEGSTFWLELPIEEAGEHTN
ncbi:MAG: PAS domain S-box protein [Cyanobacteria bacterium]|nr:PAS domain S-box protein [Cyanobacteriota bacterium]